MTEQLPWTNQTAFTTAAKGMLKQGKQSLRYSEDRGSCAYRGMGGTCCGVGFLMPDELARLADKKLNSSIPALIRDVTEIKELFKDVSVAMLSEIQCVHDTNLPKDWEESLKVTAKNYNLKWEL